MVAPLGGLGSLTHRHFAKGSVESTILIHTPDRAHLHFKSTLGRFGSKSQEGVRVSRDTHRRQETPVHAPDEKYRPLSTGSRPRTDASAARTRPLGGPWPTSTVAPRPAGRPTRGRLSASRRVPCAHVWRCAGRWSSGRESRRRARREFSSVQFSLLFM